MFFNCYICGAEKPVDFRNRHHKVPKSLGGTDSPDNLVDLCPGCHQEMHAIARMMRNPKRVGEVRTAVQMNFPDPAAASRCLDLAQLECRSKVMNKEKVQADPEREIGVSFKLKRPYRDALQLIARDRGMSMSNFVRKLVEGHVRQAYPSVEDQKNA